MPSSSSSLVQLKVKGFNTKSESCTYNTRNNCRPALAKAFLVPSIYLNYIMGMTGMASRINITGSRLVVGSTMSLLKEFVKVFI